MSWKFMESELFFWMSFLVPILFIILNEIFNNTDNDI